MRTMLVVGALIVGAAVAASRPPASTVEVRERRMELPLRVEVPVEVPKAVDRVRVETRTVEKIVERPAPPAGEALAQEKMLFLFERELSLRPDQRRAFLDLLIRRHQEIEAYQRQILASQVFHTRTYERRVTEIQGAYYEKMGSALDEGQRPRFAALVGEGRLGDAVVFDLGSTRDSLMILED